MNDNRTITICLSAVAAVGLIVLGSCEIYQSSLIADMVKSGADPVRAACAFSPDKRNNPACLTVQP